MKGRGGSLLSSREIELIEVEEVLPPPVTDLSDLTDIEVLAVCFLV